MIEYQTLNHAGPITRFDKLLIEQTATSMFRTVKGFECVDLLVIELKPTTIFWLQTNKL